MVKIRNLEGEHTHTEVAPGERNSKMALTFFFKFGAKSLFEMFFRMYCLFKTKQKKKKLINILSKYVNFSSRGKLIDVLTR